MKNNKAKIIIGIVVIAVIAGTAYYFLGKGSTAEITVETLTVEKGGVSKMVTATGTVQPINEVEVGTQVSGEVEKIYVDYNSEVTKGQLLAELDKTNLKASLLQAQASYDNALVEKNYLEKIYKRQKQLYEKGLISEADYDESEYNFKNAESTVTQRLSDLKTAQTNLSYADIYSPIDGVVLSREVDEGQTVAASYETPTLFTIARDLREMQVEADVDEADIGQVEEGQRVTFTVDAYQGVTFNGEVTQVRLDPTEESNVITYTVVIKAENPDLKLKPGLTATISIYTLELEDILTIQSKAVNFQPNMALLMAYEQQQGIQHKKPSGPPPGEGEPTENSEDMRPPRAEEGSTMVWTFHNGEIKPTPIQTGASDGVNVQVLSGLNEGDSLVYKMETVSADAADAQGDASSPFMPKPPGSNKKK